MTNLSGTRNSFWHEEIFVELEYFVSELFASVEFSVVATALSFWLFLRLYWLGLCLIGRSEGYKIN